MHSSSPVRGLTSRSVNALLGAALLALGSNHARAAEEVDPFALSPEQLFDATVMSVSKSDEKLKDVPAAVYVLTNEAIMRSGATSIAEALRGVPGMQVARGNANAWAISVRGFNSGLANKLLVLIDGREVYDALFSGVYWDIQDYPLEDIERIEVVRGPGATLWGANAVNGVINIITKSAAKTNGALLSVIAGDEDRAIVTGRYGAKEDGVNWRVYGKYLDRAETHRRASVCATVGNPGAPASAPTGTRRPRATRSPSRATPTRWTPASIAPPRS